MDILKSVGKTKDKVYFENNANLEQYWKVKIMRIDHVAMYVNNLEKEKKFFETINEQLSKNAQSYPTNSKTSSSVAPFLMN